MSPDSDNPGGEIAFAKVLLSWSNLKIQSEAPCSELIDNLFPAMQNAHPCIVCSNMNQGKVF